MRQYRLSTKISWSQTMTELEYEMDKWGVREWTTNYPRGARLTGFNQSLSDKTVTLTYKKNGKTVNLRMDKQDRAIDNLRVLYLTIEAMRKNELRGISEVMESAYLQLAAPTKKDPYELLEISRTASLEVATAAYRAKAMKAHPDRGGSVEQMQELSEAIEQIKREKSV